MRTASVTDEAARLIAQLTTRTADEVRRAAPRRVRIETDDVIDLTDDVIDLTDRPMPAAHR
jgi:hypothetical protein